MNFSSAIKIIAACAFCVYVNTAFSHISLEQKSAVAGSTYKAVFQVSHGCQGSATTAISVQLPPGFQNAKPYPKPGWTLTTATSKLTQPYNNHGKPVTDEVTEINWTASSKEAALQDAYFDEFMLRGKLPDAAFPLWFKVLQTCENGKADWSQIPTGKNPAQKLEFPALRLEVTGSGSAVATPSLPNSLSPVIQTQQVPSHGEHKH